MYGNFHCNAVLSFSYAAAPAKDKIRIGWVTSLSGPYASGVPGTYGMVYDLWIEEVNAKAGYTSRSTANGCLSKS